MMEALRAIKAWQIGVLVVVLVAGIGGTYGAYNLITDSGQHGLEEGQQLIPVTRDDLVNEVSINGSLSYPNRETLGFGVQGTVGEVFVEEGQQVEEGQPLATLDAETVASLEKAVAQAEVSLRDATYALDAANEPYTALDFAEAEAKVANANASVQSAQDTLTDLLSPTAKAVAEAESKVAEAEISLEQAQDNLTALLDPSAQEIAQADSKVSSARTTLKVAEEVLALLLNPSAQDVAKAESAVVKAKIALEDATETLAELVAGPTEEDISAAESKVSASKTVLANAVGDLGLTQIEWSGKVEAEQEAAGAALEEYSAVFSKWLGIELTVEEADTDPDSLIESWGTDLASLFDAGARFQDLAADAQSFQTDDPETRWNESVVSVWVNFYPGTISADCEGGVPFEGVCVKTEIDGAWDAHQDAQEQVATVSLQADKAVANAEAAVTRATDDLAADEEHLTTLHADPDPLELDSRQTQVAVTAASVAAAEEELAALKSGPNETDVAAKQAQVALAKANLDDAISDAAGMTNGKQALEQTSREKQVQLANAKLDEAESQLAELLGASGTLEEEKLSKQLTVAIATANEAQSDLADVLEGADELKVALREAEVAAVQASLDTARQRLEDATIAAPWNGLISAVNMEPGDQANAAARSIEIVDPTTVEIDGSVDEIDVLFIRVGATASVTMDALAGQTLPGVVSDIADEPVNQQGIVSYPMSIQVQVPQGFELPEGLSAVASVVIREDLDVLLVPVDSLYGSFEQPVVRVSTNGAISDREVVLGNSDGFWVVVQDGLVEAELVVMESQAASTQQGFQALRGIIGGGFGGPVSGFGRSVAPGSGFGRGGGR